MPEAPVQASTVQISTELVSSILASVEELKSSVSNLEADNQRLRKELGSVKLMWWPCTESRASSFASFLNCQNIWILACTEPQVHVLRDEYISRSRIHTIFNICAEAREVVLDLELDHFMHANHCNRKQNTEAIKNYFNPQLDTIWINRPCPNFVEDVNWTCGRCNSHKRTSWPRCTDRCITSGSDGPAGLYRLAFNFSAWKQPSESLDGMGPAELLLRHSITELLLVVGDIDTFESDRDVFFESPVDRPFYTATNTFSREAMDDDPGGCYTLTWEEMELNVTRNIQKFKDNRTAELKAILETDHATDDEIDTVLYWEEQQGFSKWTIPKIKFVVPRSHNSDWIHRASTNR
ncbi:hypothetical protein DL98DRAFT_662240 [Cadophora sp. DSE1049]|nr:hypothetical protein DL98DRAFT_662240 [Cadophora sp. DSE1049]